MNLQEFTKAIATRFPDTTAVPDPLDAEALVVSPNAVPDLFAWLHENEATNMQYLEYMSAADYPPERLRLVYSLFSFAHGHRLVLKIDIPRDSAVIPTVSHIWQNADWNEREVFDLLGVNFIGHPDLRRLLMPEDWEGAPLRKDYSHPGMVHRPD